MPTFHDMTLKSLISCGRTSPHHHLATMLALTLASSACTKTTQGPDQSLVGSSGGIGEADVAMDVTAAAIDSGLSQVEPFGASLDASNSDLPAPSTFDTESEDPDSSSSGEDVECPVFVPADEPDYGKPTQPPSSMADCSLDTTCPDGEFCTATFYPPEGVTTGQCYRVCYHPKSDTPSELGCDSTQFCSAVAGCTDQSVEDAQCDPARDINVEWIGFCGPKSRTKGGLGGHWDYSQCPCDNPNTGMTPEEKATCEEAWADMQNQ